MAGSPLTEADVHQAAWALIHDGTAPTGDAVRALLGRGSNTTIYKHLGSFWLQVSERTQARATPDMPAEIAELATELWQRTSAAAQRVAIDEVRSLRTALEARERAAAAAVAEADQRIALALEARDDANKLREAALEERNHLRAGLRDLQAAFAKQEQTLETTRSELAISRIAADDARAAVAALQVAHTQAVQDLSAAHTAELARLADDRERAAAVAMVGLDRERQAHASTSKAAAKRERELEAAVAAARDAQVKEALRSARLDVELEQARAQGAALQTQLASAHLEARKSVAEITELQAAIKTATAAQSRAPAAKTPDKPPRQRRRGS